MDLSKEYINIFNNIDGFFIIDKEEKSYLWRTICWSR